MYLFFMFSHRNYHILFRYDLQLLAGKQYTVKRNNASYAFGICNVANSPCPDKAGACETGSSSTKSLGIFNTNLMFDETARTVYLLYKTGTVCEGISKQWTTRIEFVCAADNDAEGPVIIENSNCELVIKYHTQIVCQKEVIIYFYFFFFILF